MPYGTYCKPVGSDDNLLTDTETGRELLNMKEASRHRADGGSKKTWRDELVEALETLPYVDEVRYDDPHEPALDTFFHVSLPKVRDEREERVVNFSQAWLEASNIRAAHVHTVDVGTDSIQFNITVP